MVSAKQIEMRKKLYRAGGEKAYVAPRKLDGWLGNVYTVNVTLTRYNEKTDTEYEIEVLGYGEYDEYDPGDYYTPSSGGGFMGVGAMIQRHGCWKSIELTKAEEDFISEELESLVGSNRDASYDPPDYEPSYYGSDY